MTYTTQGIRAAREDWEYTYNGERPSVRLIECTDSPHAFLTALEPGATITIRLRWWTQLPASL
jgi:hypothetical protein